MDANKAAVRLTLDDGTDLSDKVNPRLISLSLTEKRGEEADSLEITLHNHDGQIAPPRRGAMLQLALGWEKGADVTVDRKSVVEGKSVSVRVDLGGRRIIKKKKNTKRQKNKKINKT